MTAPGTPSGGPRAPRTLTVPLVLLAAAGGAALGAGLGVVLVLAFGVAPTRAVLAAVVVGAGVAASGLLVPHRAPPVRWPPGPRGDQSGGWHQVALRAAAQRRRPSDPKETS